MKWIWLSMGLVFLLINLFTGFRLFLCLAGGFSAAALVSSLGLHWAIQVLLIPLVTGFLELILKPLFRKLRREKPDSKTLAKIGLSGKIRDVVNRQKELFLMHTCDGEDMIAIPEKPGTVALGHMVTVVGVRGKKVVVTSTGSLPSR